MFSTLILSHGTLAAELLAAARKIVGEMPDFRALSLSWDDGLEAAREQLRREIEAIDGGAGVLILVDVYGSTPFNAAQGLVEPGRVELLAGVNLPMVLRLGCLKTAEMPVDEAAEWLMLKGQKSICRVRSALGQKTEIAPCDEDG